MAMLIASRDGCESDGLDLVQAASSLLATGGVCVCICVCVCARACASGQTSPRHARVPWAEFRYTCRDVTPLTSAARKMVDVFTLTQQYHNLNVATRSRNQTSPGNVGVFLLRETRDKIKNQSFVVLKYTCKTVLIASHHTKSYYTILSIFLS